MMTKIFVIMYKTHLITAAHFTARQLSLLLQEL